MKKGCSWVSPCTVLLVATTLASAAGQSKKLPLPGTVFSVQGRTAFVIEPPESSRRSGPMPWVWYAPTLRNLPGNAERWMFDRFLAAGVAIAGVDVGESYGSPEGCAGFQALYAELTSRRGYGNKPVLLARSRGGLMLYSWAIEHPDAVGGIAGIYPVCNLASYPGIARAAPAYEMTADALTKKLTTYNPIDRLEGLAKAGVPILHIHGDRDGTVPLEANSELVRKRYLEFGGPVEIEVVEGQGHNMWRGWFESERLTRFAIGCALGQPIEPARRKSVPSALASVPDPLPDPDVTPPDRSKPVRVYILAGQSNMLRMGDVTGGSRRHAEFHVSADPGAERGVTVSVYEGEYAPDADYDHLTPRATGTAPLGAAEGKFPTIPGAHTHVARGFVSVRDSGKYTFSPGYGPSTHNVMELDGREVYRKNVGRKTAERVMLELVGGKRYPIKITYFTGGWVPLWIERHGIPGTLATLVEDEGRFPHLVDRGGRWRTRNDVHHYDARIKFKGSPLSIGSGIGPELQFGHVVGHAHREQVLLIKTAMGNRALAWDFRPPSSGDLSVRPADAKWEGREYRLMVEGVRKTLANIADIVPGYRGQGYEISGFAWFQGHKDGGNKAWIDEYERNLVNLIRDVRAEFRSPALPVVIATVGFGGADMPPNYQAIRRAQLAVSGETGKYPEFAGNVLTVDARPFWRSVENSPRDQGYHYNRNAETYMLVGDALGRGMVRLLAGGR